VSKETISRITDKVIEEMQTWQARPLEPVYAAIFIDAIMVKVRDEEEHDGPCAGSQHSTHSPSPSPTAGRQQRPTDEDRRKHR